jgi:metal-responsive CopG/Arc/MetJ family transcriptional regulator
MQPHHPGYCKVTISLPCVLVEYADQEAARTSQSRSEIISRALALAKKAHRDELAARGYAFYAQESEAFADSAGQLAGDWLATEDWGDER